MTPERELLNVLRPNFQLFAVKAFHIVNPGEELNVTAAFTAIAHKLSEVVQGTTRRLIINVPPRSGKSLLTSIALPAFILGRDPKRRIICASYSSELALKLARDCRTVIQHPTYGRLFPATVIAGKNSETEFETAQGGFRYATSVGGTLTGRGGNLIIIDDPMKPEDAQSAAGRERVWQWFTGTLGSRLDNKAEDAIVLVMQRLHVDDLSGRLLKQGGWELLSIPAIAETEQVLTVAPGRIHVRKPGDVLDPKREPPAELENLRRQLGSANFSAQYQQQPIPPEGALVKRAWIHTYKQLPPRHPGDMIVQSWDCAYKVGDGNDYSACTTWLMSYDGEVAYLIDVWRDRLEFPALVRKVLELRTFHQAALVLIEDSASGMSLIQELKARGCPVSAVKPSGDKVVRLTAGSVLIEGGNILFPERPDQRFDAYMSELLAFPYGSHDDQVDSTSQFLIWFNDRRHTPKSIAGAWGPSGFHPIHAGVNRVRMG